MKKKNLVLENEVLRKKTQKRKINVFIFGAGLGIGLTSLFSYVKKNGLLENIQDGIEKVHDELNNKVSSEETDEY